MRTSPVALAYVGDWQAITEAARLVNDLTHADPVSLPKRALSGL